MERQLRSSVAASCVLKEARHVKPEGSAMSVAHRRSTVASLSLAILVTLTGLGSALAQNAPRRPSGGAETAPAMNMDQTGLTQPAITDDSGALKRADADMGRVLRALEKLGGKPIETLAPEEARRQPTPADAVRSVLRDQGRDPEALIAQMRVSKQDITYSGPAGDLPARVYTPEGAPKAERGLPVIVYFHGGGWVIADLDTYEPSALALARKANAIVVSAEYRLAPEAKFPAQHEDAVAAYAWVLANAQKFGGDPTRVAVAGESAGGNLAFHVAAASRDGQFQAPAHMLLVYPVAGTDMNTPSYQKNANAKPLSKAMMAWFVQHAAGDEQDLQNPMLNILGKANLKDLPNATVITAEIDPLQSEGKALADKLKAAGSQVTYQNFDGVAHEFFGMDAVVADAAKAQELAARELTEAFGARTTSSTKPAQQRK
jgi:acetyl esterase